MMSTSNPILSDMVDVIRIRIRIRQKYKNKYDISVMCPYPIRFDQAPAVAVWLPTPTTRLPRLRRSRDGGAATEEDRCLDDLIWSQVIRCTGDRPDHEHHNAMARSPTIVT